MVNMKLQIYLLIYLGTLVVQQDFPFTSNLFDAFTSNLFAVDTTCFKCGWVYIYIQFIFYMLSFVLYVMIMYLCRTVRFTLISALLSSCIAWAKGRGVQCFTTPHHALLLEAPLISMFSGKKLLRHILYNILVVTCYLVGIHLCHTPTNIKIIVYKYFIVPLHAVTK